MILGFTWINGLALCIDARRDHIRPLVHTGEKESWADAGTSVNPGAVIAMPASSNLEVEGAVHPILLRPKDGRQVPCHQTPKTKHKASTSAKKKGEKENYTSNSSKIISGSNLKS